MNGSAARKRAHWVLLLYGLYLALPIYWLLRLALQSNQAILAGESDLTFGNFVEIFSNPVWYQGFANSLSYVAINTVISVSVALPICSTREHRSN